MEKDEYEETLADTKEQLVEFKEALDKITEGDVTLLDALSRMRVAIQAAISDAFKTPEVVAMFMKKEPGQLRQRLQQLETALKLRKIGPDAYSEQQVEVKACIVSCEVFLLKTKRFSLRCNGSEKACLLLKRPVKSCAFF